MSRIFYKLEVFRRCILGIGLSLGWKTSVVHLDFHSLMYPRLWHVKIKGFEIWEFQVTYTTDMIKFLVLVGPIIYKDIDI